MATLAHPARTAGDQGLPYGLKGTSKGEDYLISFWDLNYEECGNTMPNAYFQPVLFILWWRHVTVI